MKRTIDGTAINIAVRSTECNTQNTPLILLHGAANDSDAWRDLMPMFENQGIDTYAPDLPGHGQSAGEPLQSIEALADWVLRLADALGLEKLALAGHSMGSLVALEAAARGDKRISHLGLLGASAPMPVSQALLDTARTQPDTACRMVTAWSHTPSYFITGGGGHGVWGVGKTLAVMRRNSSTLAIDLENCNRYENGLTAAAAVQCENMLIVGKRDRMTPLRSIQPLQESLKDVSRYEIADCGHAMMTEKPKEVAVALLKLLGR